MPLKGKQRRKQRRNRHADANVHVHAKGVDEGLPREKLLPRAKLEKGERRAVKAVELFWGEGVLKPVLDLGDENDDADGDAKAAAKDAHLRNDALRDGFASTAS